MILRLVLSVLVLVGLTFTIMSPPIASAHQSGCHRWHSCPSDTGSYVCGDRGYYSGCPGGGPNPTPRPVPIYRPPANNPPVFVPSPYAGFPLSSSQACGVRGRIDVTFRWNTPPSNAVQQQWIDLSIFDNGFAGGTFIGAGPFAPWIGEFTWGGLLPDTTHYWRANALVGGVWLPSPGYAFTTGHC